MNAPLSPEPVGYFCDHSDEPFGSRTHHGWEWDEENGGHTFQHMPNTISSHSGPDQDYLKPEDRSRRCPRAVPVYAVDAPALLAEVERLKGLLHDVQRIARDKTAEAKGRAEALRAKGEQIAELERQRNQWESTARRMMAAEAAKPEVVVVPPASFVLQAMNRVPDSLPRCPVCTFAPAYCTCFGKTHRFDPERLGVSEAKRRLANCVGCGQPRNAPCHDEAGDPR